MLSDDKALVNLEPELPALETVLCVPQMLATLRNLLPDEALKSALKRYIRYKPGTNCIVKYDLTGKHGAFAVYVKAWHRHDNAKMVKARQRQNEHPGSRNIVIDASQHLVCYRFPADEKLKLMPRLFDPEKRDELLERVLYEPQAFRGCTAEVMQYKPERRLVLKLIAPDGRKAVLKLYTRERYQIAVSTIRQRLDGERILSIAGKSEKHRILVYEWIDGHCLTDEYQSARFHHQNLEQVGAHLAKFHDYRRIRRLAKRDTGDFVHSLEQLVLGAARLRHDESGDVENRIRQLGRKLSKAVAGLSSKKTRIHGDFYAKQVLYTGEGIRLIDFDDVCHWYPAYDLGLFIAHLTRDCLAQRLPVSFALAYEQALLKGYGSVAGYRAEEVQLFTAVGLLQLIHHPFRNAEARWPQQMDAILCQCEHRFEQYQRLREEDKNQGGNEADKHENRGLFLTELLDKSRISPVLKRALAEALPEAEGELLSAELVRLKSGKRALIEYTFCGAERSSPVTVIGKVRSKGADSRTYCLNRALYQSGFSPGAVDDIQVPEPLGVIPDHHIWFQRKVPGINGFEAMSKDAAGRVAPLIARGIAKLHCSDLIPERQHTLADELAILHKGLCLVSQQHLEWANRLEALFERCQQLAAKLPEVKSRPVHRDFYHDQLLLDDGRLYLLDLDLMSMGDPALDVGNFVAHIQEQCLRKSGDLHQMDDKLASFVAAYRSFVPGVSEDTVQIYTLLSWARHIYISQRIQARNPFTERIMAWCEAQIERLLKG